MLCFKLKKIQSDQLAQRMFQYYNFVSKTNSKMTWLHFKEKGFKKVTIYGYMKGIGLHGKIIFKSKPIRTPRIATKKKKVSILKHFRSNPSTTVAIAAKALKMKDHGSIRSKFTSWA